MSRPYLQLLIFACLPGLGLGGCSSGTPAPGSRWGIASTSRNNSELVLDFLPLKDFPGLKKFHSLKGVSFRGGTATDAKLLALADVGFSNLHWISMDCPMISCRGIEVLSRIHSLTNVGLRGSSERAPGLDCPLITDCSIESLSRIPSLRSLHLSEAAITDRGLEIIITRMRLTHISLLKCSNVTAHAMVKLVQTETLTRFDFSCENLTETGVSESLEAARNIKECWIYYPNSIARTPAVAATAQRKGIKLVFEGVGFWTTEGWELSGRRPLSPD